MKNSPSMKNSCLILKPKTPTNPESCWDCLYHDHHADGYCTHPDQSIILTEDQVNAGLNACDCQGFTPLQEELIDRPILRRNKLYVCSLTSFKKNDRNLKIVVPAGSIEEAWEIAKSRCWGRSYYVEVPREMPQQKGSPRRDCQNSNLEITIN